MSRWAAAFAALVSLILPGAGPALAGAPRRAIAIAAFALCWQSLFLAAQAAPEVTPLLLSLAGAWLVLVIAATLAIAADAWRLARAAAPLRLRGGPRGLILPVTAAVALNLATLAFPFEFPTWRSYHIPSASMLPALVPGDRILVQEGWYDTAAPRRGDIAVFTLPPTGDAYVKRIAGLPGDRLQMRAGILSINGTPVPATPLPDGHQQWRLPDGPAVDVIKQGFTASGDTTDIFAVPPGHVFMLGDNLDNSYDSRLDPRMRYVPITALVGRATIIYWPPARYGTEIR